VAGENGSYEASGENGSYEAAGGSGFAAVAVGTRRVREAGGVYEAHAGSASRESPQAAARPWSSLLKVVDTHAGQRTTPSQ
jgi:hypothetical protein